MDKKTLPLIIVLAVLVFFYWPILQFLGLAPEPEPQTTAVDTVQTQPLQQPETPSALQQGIQQPDLVPATPADIAAMTGQSDRGYVKADSITVSTNKFTVTLSSLGGGPVSIVLKEHTLRDGSPIEMMPEALSATPEATFGGGNYSTSNVLFTSNKAPGNYDVRTGSVDLIYRHTNETGAEIIRKYTFYADRYKYDLDFQVTNPASFGFESKYNLVWNTPMGIAEPNPKTDYDAMQAVAMYGGSREALDDYEDGRLSQSLDGTTTWAGVRNQYFSAAIIPSNRQASGVLARGSEREVVINGEKMKERKLTVGLEMEFVSSAPIADSFTVYVGPLDYNLMAEYNVDLEAMLDIGTTPYIGWIIKPFAIAIIWLLPRMYDILPNYGFVIILFAFLVKVVTLPLSMKSFKSMQAMKDLQPQLEKLKEQYKKNPQQLNQETMKMYKKHGVNPMSGCLPMLPQMPLFFALFSVFRSTILLRGAEFIWFIDDLSRGAQSFTDPYIILVLFMVGAQFVSQKLTMGASQQNKMMMYIMPVFMGWIFHTFAAGLVLYWACFSVFSLLDYVLFKRKTINQHVKTA